MTSVPDPIKGKTETHPGKGTCLLARTDPDFAYLTSVTFHHTEINPVITPACYRTKGAAV